MRTFGKFLGRALLALIVLGAALYLWKKEEITRVMAVMSLFSEEKIVHNFSHMDQSFLTMKMNKGPGPVSPLPQAEAMELPDGTKEWIEQRSVTALVVLKDGEIHHESYHLGTGAEDRRISWSVAKSFLSALFGIVLSDGAIDSIDDKVIKYVPELKGTAYDQASIKDVLQMSSGVTFNEDYLDFWSDINRMGRVVALGMSLDDFTKSLDQNDAAPGMAWHYVSIDTHVIGMVMRGATGRNIPDLMQEKIFDKMGFEADPFYVADGYETAFVLGGLNLRTRDYARFGQMVLQNGTWQGQEVVPAQWLAASTTPSAKTEAGAHQYGYQWWMPHDAQDGEFFAIGIYGQYIYFDTERKVVIAVNSADRKFREPGVTDANIAMFRKLERAVE